VIVPYPAWRACHMLARLASPLPRQLLQAFPSQPLPRRLSDRLFVSTLFPRLGWPPRIDDCCDRASASACFPREPSSRVSAHACRHFAPASRLL